MATTRKPDTSKLALFVGIENEYGQLKLVASVVEVQDNGELHGTSWSGRFGDGAGAEFDGFRISAYIDWDGYSGSTPDQRGVWGPGVSYRAHHIDSADQATAIARTLTRIEAGLRKMSAADGYLTDSDFGAYVARIAKILKIGKLYVRQTKRARDMSGNHHRAVSTADLQSYVLHAVSEIHAGKRSEYVS
jgi:hypothetical protein